MPAFDKELWGVAGDDESRLCCGVLYNSVSVRPARGKEYSVLIKPPTGLFHYLRKVHSVSIESARQDPMSFYLEESDGCWFFGLFLPYAESLDLWPYRTLPAWARRTS